VTVLEALCIREVSWASTSNAGTEHVTCNKVSRAVSDDVIGDLVNFSCVSSVGV
jgi:hypothetical protein